MAACLARGAEFITVPLDFPHNLRERIGLAKPAGRVQRVARHIGRAAGLRSKDLGTAAVRTKRAVIEVVRMSASNAFIADYHF